MPFALKSFRLLPLRPLRSTSLHRRIVRFDIKAVNSFSGFFRELARERSPFEWLPGLEPGGMRAPRLQRTISMSSSAEDFVHTPPISKRRRLVKR